MFLNPLPFLLSQARDISCHHSPTRRPASVPTAVRQQEGQEGTKPPRFLFLLSGRVEKRMKAVLEEPVKVSCFSLLPWERAVGSGSSAELFLSLPMTSPTLQPWRRRVSPARPGSSLLCPSLGQVLFRASSQNIIFRIT